MFTHSLAGMTEPAVYVRVAVHGPSGKPSASRCLQGLVKASTPSMVLVTWKSSEVPLMGRPVVPATAEELIPNQSTAQPTPKRDAHELCVLLPDSVPQSQVPPPSTATDPVSTLIEPSALVLTVPLMMPVPFESGRGLAAFASAGATV